VRPVPAVSKLTLTVAAAVADGAAGYPGDTVVFRYTARNDGTTALGNVRFADRRIGLSSFVYGDWPGADGVLLPGQSITATASYVLREGELGALLEVRAEVTAVLLGSSILVADTADAALQLPDPPDPATPLPSLPQVLAYTGSDQGMTLLGGFALLVFGLALTLTSRKKKRKDIA
jgi:LPXTG-motif cell wall-anchored protein